MPEELRALIGSRQKACYPLLLRESAGALADVARRHKDLGAELGLMAVLQTWTRDLRYHPHVHCVVPGGGLSEDQLRWVRPKSPDYFLPQRVLAARFRNRLKAGLAAQLPEGFHQIPRAVWRKPWVADVQPVGRGEGALKYLAAYVYRTALSAERIVADDGEHITFGWRDNQGANRTTRLRAEAFLHRFLQHVLPKGLQRVRYFGWLGAAAKKKFERIAALLDWRQPELIPAAPLPPPLCPRCNIPMIFIGRLPRGPPRHHP